MKTLVKESPQPLIFSRKMHFSSRKRRRIVTACGPSGFFIWINRVTKSPPKIDLFLVLLESNEWISNYFQPNNSISRSCLKIVQIYIEKYMKNVRYLTSFRHYSMSGLSRPRLRKALTGRLRPKPILISNEY